MMDFETLVAEIWLTMRNDPGRYAEAFEQAARQNPEAAAAYVGHPIEHALDDTHGELGVDSRGNIVGPVVLLSERHRVTKQTPDGIEVFVADFLDPVPFGSGEEERSE